MREKPRHLVWRNGRPRWEPSPTARKFGLKGMDLKYPDRKFMTWDDACHAADRLNAELDALRCASEPSNFEEKVARWKAKSTPRPQPDQPQVVAALPTPSRFKAGYVYFLWVGAGVKIGFSTKPIARLDSLWTGASEKPAKVAVLRGTLADEQRLHKRFNKHRSHREWFRSSRELNEILNEMFMAGTTNIP